MGCLGNFLWFIFGGAITGLIWLIFGVLWCITIIGIPLGIQCFKFANLSFFPFGRDVVYRGGTGSLILNILWIALTGIPMAIEAAIIGVMLCVTIIGIPFGMQFFKLARLFLMPFGSEII